LFNSDDCQSKFVVELIYILMFKTTELIR